MAKKSSGGASKGRWARNKSDRQARQEALWGGREKIARYGTERMKGVGGRKADYHIQRYRDGRKRILDTGLDAPEGYYSDGSRYYKLKRNARISRDSSDAAKAWWHGNNEHILGADPDKAGGFLDNAGRQGQISRLDGEFAEVNFRKTAPARRQMDRARAWYEGNYGGHAGTAGRAKSRYIIKIGQDGREA